MSFKSCTQLIGQFDDNRICDDPGNKPEAEKIEDPKGCDVEDRSKDPAQKETKDPNEQGDDYSCFPAF